MIMSFIMQSGMENPVAEAWFPIGKGPVLKASKDVLDALRRYRGDGRIEYSYRVGNTRWNGSLREVQIQFGSTKDAEDAKSHRHLGL